jgi:methanol:N,N-dimethyl-4-nitrosoaniline oxidoreductase
MRGVKEVINKNIFEFPIIYMTPLNRIAIGWGVHETVADECKMANIKKALIVTTGLKKTGIIETINHILTSNSISTVIYNKVTSNPKDNEVMEAYQVFKNEKCDGIVSVGGGSSHDCAKGIRAVAANNGKYICDMAMSAFSDPPWMEQVKEYKPSFIPHIAVNTTAGTGAESTFGGMVTHVSARTKIGFTVSGGLSPTAALIDPLLIRLMPQDIAAWTGIDAITHGIETFLSRIQSRHSIALTLMMIKLVSENLREFVYNRMNNGACENMCWAANMAAAALHFGGGAGIVHGIGHQISAITDSHHGLTNGVIMVPLERYNVASCPDKFALMAQAMGVNTQGLTKMQAADKWFYEMERFLTDLNIKEGHLTEQFGLQEKDIEHIVEIYSTDFCLEGNPADYDHDKCVALIKNML